jgi:hypothetical protein
MMHLSMMFDGPECAWLTVLYLAAAAAAAHLFRVVRQTVRHATASFEQRGVKAFLHRVSSDCCTYLLCLCLS